MYTHLLYAIDGPVCHITLNRPEIYNALSIDLIREITEAIKAAGSNEAVRVVVLTGAGEKAFSSGADLKEIADELQHHSLSAGNQLRTTYHPMIQAIRTLPKPVICRLNGLAVGAGCSLALACDVIIAREDAYLSLLFVQIGLMPDAGATFILPRLVGLQKAFELASTGRRVSASEAEQMGLITRSVPPANLDATVEAIVSRYAEAPTQAIGAMKLALNHSFGSDLEQQLETEAQLQDQVGQSQDATEGILAFLAKRPAVFQGK